MNRFDRIAEWVMTIGTALFLAYALVAGASMAWGQQNPPCAPRARLAYQLANEYREAPAWEGIAENGDLVELWFNPRSGTWTLLRSEPATPGMVCLMVGGDAGAVLPFAIMPPPGRPT